MKDLNADGFVELMDLMDGLNGCGCFYESLAQMAADGFCENVAWMAVAEFYEEFKC